MNSTFAYDVYLQIIIFLLVKKCRYVIYLQLILVEASIKIQEKPELTFLTFSLLA